LTPHVSPFLWPRLPANPLRINGVRPPAEQTLWRWLDRAVSAGGVRREGAGRRNDPFRYVLPEMPAKWEQQRQDEIERLSQGVRMVGDLTAEEMERRQHERMSEVVLQSLRAQEETLSRLSGQDR
jgi:hypothetical protein